MSEIIEFPMDRIRKPRAEAEERAEELSRQLEAKTQKLSERIDDALTENSISTEAPHYSEKEYEAIQALSREALGTRQIDWNAHIPTPSNK